MTRRGLTLALAISLCSATGAGVAHADGCTTGTPGTYRIDGVFGGVPQVRMGGSLTIDNKLHLDAPDQGTSAFEVMVIPVRQQGGYTPGRAPSVSLSVDGGPSHRFSLTWRPATRSGDLGTWISNRVEFGGLSRGVHVLHENLSVPVGSPNGIYELGAYAFMEGPCGMVTGTRMGHVSYEFTGGTPARATAPASGGSTTGRPSPRATATGTPEPVPTAKSPFPVPSGSLPSSPSTASSPSPQTTWTPSPSPTPPLADSPAVVPLTATPAANGSSALPWMLGALVALAASVAGGTLALRRRRAVGDTGGAGAAETPGPPAPGTGSVEAAQEQGSAAATETTPE
ncbi:hypothetical protein [Kitasatospora sp. KL5]|uniref:hypothetical protein n=1 Tax=Kitasatospora sp. KL5 TaxID=3425125 RepID=UPI003D6F00E1